MKKKGRRWPAILGLLLLLAILWWIFRGVIESWLRPEAPYGPSIGKEKIQEEIREEEREKLEEILKQRR